jgi:uncharacterized protein YciI
MIYANYVEYGAREAILEFRPDHRRYMFGLLEQGKLVAAGSFPDDVGGLYLYEADSQESANQFMMDDPFYLGNAIKSYRILPWEVHGANTSLLTVAKMPSEQPSR